MKTVKIMLTAVAFTLAIGTAFAFHQKTTPKINGTGWFEVDIHNNLITPAVQVTDPDDLCPGSTTPCAGEYTIVNGQPTGSQMGLVKKD